MVDQTRRKFMGNAGKLLAGSVAFSSISSAETPNSNNSPDREVRDLDPEWDYQNDKNHLSVSYATSPVFREVGKEPQDFRLVDELDLGEEVKEDFRKTGGNAVDAALYSADFLEKMGREVETIEIEGRGLRSSTMSLTLIHDELENAQGLDSEELFSEYAGWTYFDDNYDDLVLMVEEQPLTYVQDGEELTLELLGVSEDKQNAMFNYDGEQIAVGAAEFLPDKHFGMEIIQPSSYAEVDHVELRTFGPEVDYF